MAQWLFGGHVIYRPHERSRLGFDPQQRLLVAVDNQGSFALRGEFRETEIQNLGVTVASDHQIFRFEVAMNYAHVVRARETFGNLNRNLQRLSYGQRTRFNFLAQRLAFDILHRDIWFAVIFTYFVNGEDVRMIQSRGRARFLKKASPSVLLMR